MLKSLELAISRFESVDITGIVVSFAKRVTLILLGYVHTLQLYLHLPLSKIVKLTKYYAHKIN